MSITGTYASTGVDTYVCTLHVLYIVMFIAYTVFIYNYIIRMQIQLTITISPNASSSTTTTTSIITSSHNNMIYSVIIQSSSNIIVSHCSIISNDRYSSFSWYCYCIPNYTTHWITGWFTPLYYKTTSCYCIRWNVYTSNIIWWTCKQTV